MRSKHFEKFQDTFRARDVPKFSSSFIPQLNPYPLALVPRQNGQTPFPSVSVLFLLPFLCLVLLAETLVYVYAGKEERKGEYDETVELELVRVQLRADDRDQNVARQVGVFLYHVIKVLQHTGN